MKPELLEIQIQDLVDGTISQEDYEILSAELKSNPEAMQLYLDYVDLANMVALDAEEKAEFTSVISIDQVINRQKRRSMKVAVLSAAAILMIGLVTMRLFFVAEKAPLLVFETSPGTQFELTHSGGNDDLEGAVLEEGSRLTLSQGTVELTFESGVKSIVMAPADFTLHDDDTLFLNKGTAWFQVPKGAEGFTVKTKDLDIVDLGTEFGVLAKPGEHDEVHVLKGKVEVTAKRLRMESATIVAGEARRIDPVGRLVAIPAKATAFITNLPKSLPYLHWSFDNEEMQVEGTHPSAVDVVSTFQGAPESCSGKVGDALRLGDGQHVDTDWPGFGGNRPRTVAFWIKLPKGGQPQDFAGIVGWGDNAGKESKWSVLVHQNRSDSKGKISIFWGNVSIQTGHVIPAESWHHVVMSDAGKVDENRRPIVQIYLDGKQMDTPRRGKFKDPVNTVTYTNDAVPFTIGSTIRHPRIAHRRRYLQADLDEIFIFDGVLSKAQVRQFYVEQISSR